MVEKRREKIIVPIPKELGLSEKEIQRLKEKFEANVVESLGGPGAMEEIVVVVIIVVVE